MIADNQLTVNASWDDRLLARLLKDLSLLGPRFRGLTVCRGIVGRQQSGTCKDNRRTNP